jgi:hypothetical protein
MFNTAILMLSGKSELVARLEINCPTLEVVKTMHGGKSSFSILMGTYVNEWEN